MTARIGLFSTLTGTTSRGLIEAVADAANTDLDAEVAFLLVNREPGESELTDASVAVLREGYDFPVLRASAVGHQPAARKAARRLATEGDEGPLWQWRDDFYASYSDRLPDTDLDLLLGDMWIWGRRQCAERCGVNLHPALPGGPAGLMWFDVIWDLIAQAAVESGVMLHRVTPEVDLGPVVTFCRYSLRTPELEELWAALPRQRSSLDALVAAERQKKRESDHPLFLAMRAEGVKRETPLILETVRAVSEGRLRLEADSSSGPAVDPGARTTAGLDLTDKVEARVAGR